MSTPAGWYDDGSGRQRWWDGQQWTEHFAPEAPAVPDVPPAADSQPYGTGTPETSAFAAGYPETSTGYVSPAEQTAPRAPHIVGWIALGAAVLGFILVCVPPIILVGWFLLFAAFVLSVVAFFLKGKKWAPIVAICLSVVGAIVGGILALVFFTAAFVTAVEDEIDYATSSPSSAFPEDELDDDADADADSDAGTSTGRPTSDEVAAGLAEIVEATGAEGYTDAHLQCIADEFVASDMSDEVLQHIAAGDEMFDDAEAALAFAEAFGDALPVCLS
ncbi:hypothetical protein HD600_000256 [Microbacterium ginsengiterrae]|uniref:DUF2510 domain-containing protein n=1 Tax=Microbacterium ginsengiterrae TaxID=546115 RepID=A0A7W9C9Y4_9MICO|nr:MULTISPECIES: DUF2510 domain-containing protein [Microbacterium]MBB5741759.1 hypothetical protein [Microbacterium ginsengiterrae]